MSDILTGSLQDESLNVVLQYQPPNLVNVSDEVNQTRVILRQPATIVNQSETPMFEFAESAVSASRALYADYIADGLSYYWGDTVFFVAPDGDDTNDGKSQVFPFRTIKRGVAAATEYISASKYANPNLSEAPRVSVQLASGFYEEEAPIIVPEWTSILGDDLRTCVVRPTYETRKQNLFQVNRGFYADGLRLEGCEIDDLTNPRSGFFFAFAPGAFITTSPYIQNCTSAFVPFDKFYAPLDPFATPQPNPGIGNGPGGMIVDDSVLDPYSPLKSMIVDAYTQVAFNGIGLVTRGAGYAQMVSFFTNFSHVGTWAIDGGHASLLNSNTTFGDYGLRSEGYRIVVVPDYSGVNSYQNEADSTLLSSSISAVQSYMMNQLQLSGSYRTDYVDSGSRIHKLTLKDSGLLIDAMATDLLALTPGKTVNWVQSQFKGQDVSPDLKYTLPTASGFQKGVIAAFRINDNTYTASVPFTQTSASRDSGYLINAAATDILYGGNERSVEAARWFWVRPSVANTTQLDPTLRGIQIVKELAQNTLEAVSQSAFVTKTNSNIQLSYTSLEEQGTGSLPTIVPNTVDSIKVTNLSSVTLPVSISQSLINQATASFEIVYSIIENGTGSLPTLITNAENLVRVTTSSVQFTTGSIALSRVPLVVSGFNTVLNIIENGTGSLPTKILNTTNNIRVTAFAPTTSSASATISEVSSSETLFSVVTSIITNGTGSLPTLIPNTSQSIKFTSEVQLISGSTTASSADVSSISASIALVANIVASGTGSLPGVITYSTQSSDPNTIAAYNLLKGNIEFIKKEVIAYISSSWSTASYDQDKCERDVGYIVSGAAEDLLYGSNSASIANGLHYYLYPSQATGSQLNFTLDGIKYANRLAQNVVQNIPYVTASLARRTAWQLMRSNIPFIQEETIAYISSSWSTASYDSLKCKRDINYIVDAVSTDILYGGNERSIEAGRYYYLYPSQATGSQLNFTIDGINYAKGLAKKLIVNTPYVAPSTASWAAKELLIKNKSLIQAEVIAYISSSWVTSSRSMEGFTYDSTKCARDVGYILDGVATDIVYGGNERSIESGRYYYLYPSQATTAQLDPTLDGIEYAKLLATKIVSGSTLVSASQNSLIARELINLNKSFIQAETIAFLSSSWRDFVYNSATCSRDVGYILDAVKTDLVYGGNQRSRDAGYYYYKYPNQATSAQDAATVAGVRYAKNLTKKILENATFVTASIARISASNALFENKADIQVQVVNRLKTNISFDEADTLRDTGYIVQAVATDILYGGNERATEAGRYFYKFPSAVLNAVKNETLEGIALIKEYAQNYLENTISKSEIPKLRTEVDIVYDILDLGTGSIANTLVTNASGATRFTTASQFTGSSTISSSLITSASNVLQTVLNIIEYGTGSVPQLVKNTSGRIKKSALTSVQFTGSLTQVMINRITASADITIDILENGTGSIPAVIANTEDNIKISGITQYTGSLTASLNDIAQVSSSFGIVSSIIMNGVGTLPTLIPYTTQSTNPNTLEAYNILKNNIPLIQAEVIAYISSSWSTASYNEVSCSRDVGYIVSGAAEDLIYGSNSSSISNGLHYYLYPSEATGSQRNFTADGIKYANNLVQKLLTNVVLTNPQANKISAYNAIRANKQFIAEEVIHYISSSWSTLPYNSEKCKRDITYIVDGITTDFLYGGNERSIESGRYYYLYPSEATGSQVEETSTGIRYVANLAEAIVEGATFNYPTQNQLDAAELLFKNKQFIAEEIIPYVSASWASSSYNADKCKRDVGYIIDGVITDIVYGGNERSIQSGVFYYLYPSQATGAELDYTLAGTRHLKGMAIEVLKNTVFVPVTVERQTAYNILTQNKSIIAQSVLDKLLDGQEKCMVCDYILAHKAIQKYIMEDPEGTFVNLSSFAKTKVGQMMAMVTGTLQSVVLNLQPTYLQEFGSLITSTSHVFEFGGSGANYLALPNNQYGIGKTNKNIRVYTQNKGRVYTSFGDETGDFYVGLDFIIRQATGTIEGRTFNKATAARFTPLILALEVS